MRRTRRQHRYVLRDVRVISTPGSTQWRFYLEVRDNRGLTMLFISRYNGKIRGWQVGNICLIHDSLQDAFRYALSLRRKNQ